MEFELAAFGGWPTGGLESIKADATKLLEEKGWRATRLALGATIRCAPSRLPPLLPAEPPRVL